MPNTFIGLIILIVFFTPGFFAIILVRRHAPLFGARSQIEILSWGCLISFITHFIIVTIIVVLFYTICCGLVSSLLDSKISEIPQKLNDIKMMHLILFVIIYSIVVFIIAALLGVLLAWIINKTNYFMDLKSVWIDAFSEKKVTLARVLLDNNFYVEGTIEETQVDPDTIISGNRDILLCSPIKITDPCGFEQQDHDTERIIVNTRNVKILELKENKPKKED